MEIYRESAEPVTTEKKRLTEHILFIVCSVTAALLLLGNWKAQADSEAFWTPDYEMADLSGVLGKQSLRDEDYEFVYSQTGLGRETVKELLAGGRSGEIVRAQKNFFVSPRVNCRKNSPISWEEEIRASDAARYEGSRFVGLEDGDILITPCSHTYGWRNGHAALVIDAAGGRTLESVVLGENSCVQKIEKWEDYPAFLVVRLKGADSHERRRIAENAVETLDGVPYGFTVGILIPKHPQGKVIQTHCAHLIWEAYRQFGYDIDYNKGPVVTPRDIANSPLLEVIQISGMDPDRLWKKQDMVQEK